MSGPGEGQAGGDPQQLESYVLHLLAETREEVKISDSKTSILFAAVATVIAFMVSILLDDESQLRTSGDAVIVLSVVALAAFMVSLAQLALAVMPRLGAPAPGKARYFQEHAQFADGPTLLEALRPDAANPIDRHTQQLLVLGRIVLRKYQHLRNAMMVISVAVGILAVTAVVGLLD